MAAVALLLGACGGVDAPAVAPSTAAATATVTTAGAAMSVTTSTAPAATSSVSASTSTAETTTTLAATDAATDSAAPESAPDGERRSAEASDVTDAVGSDSADIPQVSIPQASIPQVTLPEASIRDSEAEAADRERRQSVIGLFERLRIEAEHRGGYRRDAVFDGWLYSNGQSTRDRVLAQERRSDGTWLSAYDGQTVSAAGNLDIDHMVPLAEAWESGGHAWTQETWTRFGNDLGDPRSLIAVSASTNRSKGAKDPQDWWPPLAAYHCQYAADWIAVKSRWDLSIDAAEERSLRARLETCSGAELEYSVPSSAAVTITDTPANGGSSPDADSETDTDADTEAGNGGDSCHPAYEPCLPYLEGDALNCGDLTAAQKPVRVKVIGEDPYRLDRDKNGIGCT